jgi:hypothetical protein
MFRFKQIQFNSKNFEHLFKKKKKNFFDSCDEIVEVIQIVIKFENFIQKF